MSYWAGKVVARILHYGVRKPLLFFLYRPWWWLQGIALTADYQAARRHRMMSELLYWTGKIT